MNQEDIEKSLKKLDRKVLESIDFHTKLKSRVDSALNVVLPSINTNLNVIKNDLEKQKHMVGTQNALINQNMADISNLNSNIKKLNEFCKSFEMIQKEAMSLMEQFHQMEKKNKQEFDMMKKQNKNLDESLSQMKSDQDKNFKNLFVSKENSMKSLSDMDKKHSNDFECFKVYVMEKIENIQMPYMKMLEEEKNNVVSMVSKANEKIDKSGIDLENALLRSANNETQLKIFEKRLENIHLIIKKFEIMNQ